MYVFNSQILESEDSQIISVSYSGFKTLREDSKKKALTILRELTRGKSETKDLIGGYLPHLPRRIYPGRLSFLLRMMA
eukprot:1177870-Prorocentrum_minimum.AAC.1